MRRGIRAVAAQIGNAVVPAEGQAMGLAMSSALKGWKIEWDAKMGQSGAVRKRIVPSLIGMKCAGTYEVEEILQSPRARIMCRQ